MFIDGTGVGAAAFVRMCRDNRNIRSGSDKPLGRGALTLHILPITNDSIDMMRAFIKMSAGDSTYAHQFKQALCLQWPSLFSMNPLDVTMDMRYKGTPCYFGLDFDIKTINTCLALDEDRKNLVKKKAPRADINKSGFCVICFKWQFPYYRALFPHSATIIAIDMDRERILEYAPKPD
jgi:hypothetical protein